MTIKQITDNMTLAPGVVDTIISIATTEVDGVATLGSGGPRGVFSKLASKPSTSGIECKYNEDGKLVITLHMEVYYGYVLPELADKIRQAISDALLVQIGIEVESIDIYIDGIVFKQTSDQ